MNAIKKEEIGNCLSFELLKVYMFEKYDLCCCHFDKNEKKNEKKKETFCYVCKRSYGLCQNCFACDSCIKNRIQLLNIRV